MTKLRIVLADDHAVVREGLRALIERHADMEVVGEAGDGRTAIEVAEREQPDVVVMDLSMPGLNGSKATRELLWRNPNLKVLALTVHEERSYLRELLDAGASRISSQTGRRRGAGARHPPGGGGRGVPRWAAHA